MGFDYQLQINASFSTFKRRIVCLLLAQTFSIHAKSTCCPWKIWGYIHDPKSIEIAMHIGLLP
jgi:hypothetical protein